MPSGYVNIWVAAIAPWLRLRLPFCGRGFETQAHHLCFFNLYWNCNEKRTKINKKRLILAHFYKKKYLVYACLSNHPFCFILSNPVWWCRDISGDIFYKHWPTQDNISFIFGLFRNVLQKKIAGTWKRLEAKKASSMGITSQLPNSSLPLVKLLELTGQVKLFSHSLLQAPKSAPLCAV